MTDAISRQAAIDALTEYGNGRAVFISVGEAVIRIEQLPSAPPENIYCKDCGHRDDHGCCKYWRGLAMSEIPIATDDYDFCKHARRRERE